MKKRLLAIGGLAGLVVGATCTVMVLNQAGAASVASAVVPLTPCRLVDTRPAPENVGDRTGALGQQEAVTLTVLGTHGNCTIPSDATGINVNVTIVGPTAPSFLTLCPADAARPLTSNLNWVAGQAPTANQASVGLSASGAINVFNNTGQVDVIIDIVSYLTPSAGGAPGAPGAPGSPGVPGPPGPVASAGNWGVVARNTVGSPTAELRSGPSAPAYSGNPDDPFVPGGPIKGPPFGTGSLGLTVSGPNTEKVVFGNEIDFFSTPFNVTAVGFSVFNVPENVTAGANNMPGIAFEIDPNVTGFDTNYSTLVFQPNPTLPVGWSDFIDATSDTSGLWGLTGAAFAANKCSINAAKCTWTELQALLNDDATPPTLFTVAIQKGTDVAWNGAVDGLRINNTIYNFEEYGVVTQPAA